MKKFYKRAIATICAFVMIAGCILSEVGPVAKASEVSSFREYNIFTSETGQDIVNGNLQIGYSKSNANISLPEDLREKAKLEVYIHIYLEDETALNVAKDSYVELANVTCDKKELYWYLGNYNLTVGNNEVELGLSDAKSYPGSGDGSGVFDMSQTINWFRMHNGNKGNTTTAGYIKLYEVTLREDADAAGLLFGEDDTHLQLSSALTSTPESIQASVKMDELQKEWLIRSGHNTSWASWANISSNTKVYSTVSHTDDVTEDDVMGIDTNYVKIDLNSGQTFNFQDKSFLIQIPSVYERNELALTFWYYTSTGELPGGTILLSSNGGTTYYISWSFNTCVTSLTKGWNKITLPFSSRTGYSDYSGGDSGLDISNLNYIRWISQTATTEATTIGLSDIKIVPYEEPKEEATKEWTMVAAGDQMITAISEIGYNQVASTGTVVEGEVGPEVGTTYTKIIASPNDSDVVRLGFRTPYASATTPNVPDEYQQDDLAIAFWVYSSSGEKLPSGGIEIASGGWVQDNSIRWYTRSHTKITQGWNYIQINLDDYEELHGAFDYKKINFVQLYSDGTDITTETEYRFTDIKLVLRDDATPVYTYPVTTTEVADSTTLKDNKMILSNTNVSGETPYALFVTPKGYPALLWGTTQYTLEYDIQNGEWVDVKVARNSEGYIEFYLDGVLRGTSEVVESDTLSAFTTAHRIGADGAGGQVFDGRIANLNIYSDADATTCIGSWALSGNIEHVLETLPDASANANDAVYRGTRTNDWVTYDSVKTEAVKYVGDDYWSMVFIPDIQNLAQKAHGYDQTWYTMAQWIADNVPEEKENIKHVIGAGDNTWSNIAGEYTIAQAGFDKFKNEVSWSNMSGNHEFTWTAADRTSTLYDTYFGEDYIKGTKAEETYVGSYDDPADMSTTENSYYRFNVNGVNWMILQLEYYPRLSVLEWAKEIAAKYPADNVILTTHGYLSGSGGYCGESRAYLATGDGEDYLGTSTEKIWTELQACTNIKMILCGHSTTGTGAIVQKNEVNSVGDTVPALMINAQDLDLESNGDGSAYFSDQALGMISILRFSADGTKATVQLYCPQYDMTYDPIGLSGERDSNQIQMSYQHEAVVKEYTNVTAGTAPETSSIPDGYIFAGWYTDNTCTKAIAQGSTVESAYAKFVDESILGVKAQVRLVDSDRDGTYELPTDSTDIRFITTVDSDRYKRVGFKFVINDTTTTKDSDTVYEELYAIGQFGGDPETYTPYGQFSLQSIYFKAFTILGVQAGSYNTNIQVTPFWETLDGTVVYGEPETKTINAVYEVLKGGQ